jgi:hypothetical protein
VSDQWTSDLQETTKTTTARDKPNIIRSLTIFIPPVLFLVAIVVGAWMFFAFMAWPSKNDKPLWSGEITYSHYAVNDFLAPAGLDLTKEFPLDFGPVSSLEDRKPSFSLLGANGRAIRLSLQWHGTGYVVDVPMKIVAIRIAATNTIRVHMAPSDVVRQAVERKVAVRSQSNISNFLRFHYWIKKEERIPITRSQTWKTVQRIGAGAFFWNDRDQINSVTITLRQQDYLKYAARLPLSD